MFQSNTLLTNRMGMINNLLSLSHTEPGKRIIRIIIDNPYYDIKDIVKALTYTQYGGKKPSRWKVKR